MDLTEDFLQYIRYNRRGHDTCPEVYQKLQKDLASLQNMLLYCDEQKLLRHLQELLDTEQSSNSQISMKILEDTFSTLLFCSQTSSFFDRVVEIAKFTGEGRSRERLEQPIYRSLHEFISDELSFWKFDKLLSEFKSTINTYAYAALLNVSVQTNANTQAFSKLVNDFDSRITEDPDVIKHFSRFFCESQVEPSLNCNISSMLSLTTKILDTSTNFNYASNFPEFINRLIYTFVTNKEKTPETEHINQRLITRLLKTDQNVYIPDTEWFPYLSKTEFEITFAMQSVLKKYDMSCEIMESLSLEDILELETNSAHTSKSKINQL